MSTTLNENQSIQWLSIQWLILFVLNFCDFISQASFNYAPQPTDTDRLKFSFSDVGQVGVDTSFNYNDRENFYHTPIACELYQLKTQTSDIDPACMKTKQYKPFSGVSITEHFCCSRAIKTIISSNKHMHESKHPVLNDHGNIIAQRKL